MQGTYYTKTHEWVRFLPDGSAEVGVTAYLAQAMRGSVWINLCDEGDRLREGDWLGDIEFFKGVRDVHAPVSGTVVRVNEALLRHPQLPQTQDAWLAVLCGVSGGGSLLDAHAYQAYLAGGAR